MNSQVPFGSPIAPSVKTKTCQGSSTLIKSAYRTVFIGERRLVPPMSPLYELIFSTESFKVSFVYYTEFSYNLVCLCPNEIMLKYEPEGILWRNRVRASTAFLMLDPSIDPDLSKTNINSPGAISSSSSSSGWPNWGIKLMRAATSSG